MKDGDKFCNTHFTDGETQHIGNQGNYCRVNLAVNYTMPYYLITSGHQVKILAAQFVSNLSFTLTNSFFCFTDTFQFVISVRARQSSLFKLLTQLACAPLHVLLVSFQHT